LELENRSRLNYAKQKGTAIDNSFIKRDFYHAFVSDRKLTRS